MKNHLSDEQLSEWILGNGANDASRHLQACEVCRGEAEEMAKALGGFRESIHAAAEAYRLPWRAAAQPARAAWAGFLAHRWAYAVSVAAILVVSVVLLRVGHHRTPHPAADTVREDEILIQIQTDVSENVPSALTPGEWLLSAAEEPQTSAAKPGRGSAKSRRR